MPRTFKPISVDELKVKIYNAIIKHEDYDKNEYPASSWDDFVENDFPYYILRILTELTPTIVKDIKVKFDTENIDDPIVRYENDPPLGFQTMSNGLTFLGMSAGGDWENPVFFIIYWDGSKLRAYVPTDGNTYNTDTKEAYGNDEDADTKNIIKRFSNIETDKYGYYDESELSFNNDSILKDIAERIVKK